MKTNLPKVYLDFIKECKTKEYGELFTHKHHITPKFMGGTNENDNLIVLSVEDHFLAHKLLAENCEDEYKVGNLRAMGYLANRYSNIKITKNEISKIHKDAANLYLQNNPPFRKGKTGYKHTSEHSNNLSKSLIKWHESNSVWNKGKMCKNISDSLIEWYKYNPNPFKGKTHKKDTKLKMKENHADFNGSKNPASRKCIDLDSGIVYGCIKEMAMAIGKPRTTMQRWVQNPKIKKYSYYE